MLTFLDFWLVFITASACFELDLPNVVKNVVCRTSAHSNGVSLHTFPLSGSHYVRMLLELYFDKPLLVRTFFHECGRTSKDYLLVHTMDPAKHSRNSVFVKRNVYNLVASNCRYAADERRHKDGTVPSDYLGACARYYARRFGEYVSESFDLHESNGNRATMLDIDKLIDPVYASNAMSSIAKLRSDEGHQFDEQRWSLIQRKLTYSFVSEGTRKVGVRVLPRNETFILEFLNANQNDIKKDFLHVWTSIVERKHICEMFSELQCTVSDNADLSVQKHAVPVPVTSSKLDPDVHVLIPCKAPKNLRRCISSLTTNANSSFGQVFFHFGIDWKDEATESTIRQTCNELSVNCTVHPVYSRAGDVSAIANHMFVTIDADAYFFRFNDDTEMQTKNWNAMAIQALRQAPTDIGLAIIHDRAHIIQTHSFVSSKHRDIFGFYFPHHFKNWYEDNWITDAYVSTLHKESHVYIKHNSREHGGVRYKIESIPRDLLDHTIQSAQSRVLRYIRKHNISFDGDMLLDFSFHRGI